VKKIPTVRVSMEPMGGFGNQVWIQASVELDDSITAAHHARF
jgi:hypothetical protein